jgi:DNA-binding response OmpR family regulator
MELVTEPVNVLVIDDDPGIRSALCRVLQRAGHACVAAADAAEGLEMARASRPDLILLDIELPDCDGRDVMGQLRMNPMMADVPVIVISGYVDHYVRIQALEAGAQDVVEKPFDPVMLERRLSWVVAKCRAAASLAAC